ncbi:MAG: hypothetical protein KAT09_03055 [Candidatus Aegiribacteria sp.]|nr:hypothetical protein [Candidatus Aegiribacteria sp.]
MKILWHISSHGWGHAARQRELISTYTQAYPHSRIIIASDVPTWFWKGLNIEEIHCGSPSPIVSETGGDIDTDKSRRDLTRFLASAGSNIEDEIRFQETVRPDMVITDIDPLPVAAAAERSVPAVGIGNFTWDWIMGELFPDILDDIRSISKLYRRGTYLRLPLGPRFSPFNQTVKVPLLRSGSEGDPEKAQSILPERRICLVALRELPSGRVLKVPEEFLPVSSTPEPLAEGIYNISPEKLSDLRLTFSDIMAASDVVVSKAGYGVVSQILAMGKPCVLLKGRSFPEEPYLLEPLRDRAATRLLDRSETDLLSDAIISAASTTAPPPVRSNGADFIVSGGYLKS